MPAGRNMGAESSIINWYDGRYDMADMVIST